MWSNKIGNVRDYGAIGDGDTNDTDAIVDALEDNDQIVFPNGQYICDSISLFNTSKSLVGLGDVKILQNHVNGIFSFSNSWEEIDSITDFTLSTVDLAESGETTVNNLVSVLTLSSNHTYKRGDVVKIVSNDLCYGVSSTGASEDFRQGEYAIVAKDSTDNHITLSNVLRNIYTTSPRVGRLKRNTISIENIEFSTLPSLESSMGSTYSASVSISACYKPHFYNVRFTNQFGRGLSLNAYNASIMNLSANNLQNRPSVSRYGYGVEDLGFGTKILNISGENVRHLYSANNNRVSANSTSLERFGVTEGAIVTNGIGHGVQGAAFDTHDLSENIQFVNCLANGSYAGASSGGSGFTARGRNIGFSNCTAVRCKVGFYGNVTEGLFINDCKSLETATEGLIIEGYSPTVTTQKKIRVRNSHFDSGYNTNGVLSRAGLVGKNGYTIDDANIENTTFAVRGNVSGSRLLEFIDAKVHIKDLTLDLSQFTGSVSFTSILLRNNGNAITGDNIKILGGDSPCSNTLINGVASSNTSKVEIKNLEYIHVDDDASVVIGSNLSSPKLTWKQNIGGVITSSAYILQTATTDLVLNTAKVLDNFITLRLTGTNGNVTIANIPSGNYPGQTLMINNISNGAVTIGTPDTIIPVNGSAIFFWDGSYWRHTYNQSRTITPAFNLTVANGTNNNLASGNSATKNYMKLVGATQAFTITGLANGTDGQRLTLYNTTGQSCTLAHESSNSTDIKRIVSSYPYQTHTGNDYTLPGKFVDLIYDGSISRWLIMI